MSRVVNSENEINIEISPKFIILCDMDGTLIDTDYANYLSYRRAIEEVTRRKHELQFNSGKRLNREGLKENLPYLTDGQYKHIISLKTDYYSGHLPETKVNTTLADFIRKYSGTHETVLVTCCREKRAVETLQYHNLLGCFSRLICRQALSGSGLSNKYANAINLLSANPVASIVCENDITDIEKAILAGVPRENIISVGCRG